MYEVINFIYELLKGIFIVVMFFGMVLLLFIGIGKSQEYERKQECYEIYAIDKVIITQCKKYFELERSDSNE